jgi:hypothetical protein
VSKPYLHEYFDKNGGILQLAQCTRVEYYNKPASAKGKFPNGTSTIGYEYLDAANTRVALIFQYVAPDGSFCGGREHYPKGMLIDGTWCYI